MTGLIRRRINDTPIWRWTVLIIVATAMMMGYFVNDVMSPLETLLEMPRSTGGLGWTPADYGFFAGSSGFINVFLLMLFFSGLILDKKGIRFTGTLACSTMLIGTLIKYYAISTPTEGELFGMPISTVTAAFGFAIFGVGYEMTGITVSKAMVRWFNGYELALAMGIQLSMARLGTAAALSISAPIARNFSLSAPLLLSLALLLTGLLAFLVFCIMDRKLDASNDQQTESGDEFHWSDIGITLCSPGFWLITLFCVLFYSAVSPFLKFSTRLMVIKYGIDADMAGFFTSIAPFGTILLTPLFGYIYDRFGRGVTLIIIGTLLLSAVQFGFSLPIPVSISNSQTSVNIAIILMILFSMAYSMAPAALWPCVPKIIPLKCLGTAYALIFYIQNFGRSIIPIFVGTANVQDPTYTTSMIIFGCTSLGAVVVAIAMLLVDRWKGYGLQSANIYTAA